MVFIALFRPVANQSALQMLPPIQPVIHRSMTVSAMQGDSQVVGVIRVRVLAQGHIDIQLERLNQQPSGPQTTRSPLEPLQRKIKY